MSLRTRLILAFFLLAVVPLAAVTMYSYATNVRALREAAEREADLLAGELGQRMQLVTSQLSQRIEHLMDIAELQAEVEAAAAQPASARAQQTATSPATTATSADPSSTVVTVSSQALGDSIARSLGEAAMLLNNVELQNMRIFGRGGRPPQPAAGPTPPPAPTPATAPNQLTGVVTDPARGRSGRQGGARGSEPPRSGGGRTGETRGGDTGTAPPRSGGTRPVPPGAAAQTAAVPTPPAVPQIPPVTATRDESGRLMIDMAPVRRELLRQALPSDRRLEDLSPEERQRLAAEVNQRLLGIAQGIQLGAAELQKQAAAAEKQAASKAAAVAARVPAAPPSDLKRQSSFSGRNIDVKVERDGKVVRSMNAEVNLPNLLATVFTTSQRDRGEVPFAVAKDGTIYARGEAEKAQVAAFGDVATPNGPASVRLRDWIIVTTDDRSGSGLRLGVARPVGDSLASLRRTSARNAGLGLLFIGIALVGIVPLSGRLTRNLSVLNEAVGRIAHGDYRARVPVKSHDEVGRLAAAFNQMAGDVERHQQTAVEQERIRRELELGRQIQNEMLPHAPLTLGLTQVQGVSVPAREVGGDFFNYFVLESGQIALLMGDVSGKGVGAALLMANIQASLRIRLGLGQGLADVADALDRDIEANSPGPVYATLFLGMLDPVSRRLRFVNAGHNPQYVLRTGGGLEGMHATGLPVGLLAGRGYREESLQLAGGDQLFFYTDGCVEMENERGQMFGSERLEALLVEAAKSADPLRRIEEEIARFKGSSEQMDDATLMTVRVG
jgi:serine phosphatase RsbU (regulator of sigma subunit)